MEGIDDELREWFDAMRSYDRWRMESMMHNRGAEPANGSRSVFESQVNIQHRLRRAERSLFQALERAGFR